jgi:hypothetical protein
MKKKYGIGIINISLNIIKKADFICPKGPSISVLPSLSISFC